MGDRRHSSRPVCRCGGRFEAMSDGVSVVCAWCSATVSSGGPGDRVSHGICLDCAMDFLRRLPKEYLASIADEDGTVTLFCGYRLDIATGRSV